MATDSMSNKEILLESAAQKLGPEALETVDEPSLLLELPDVAKWLPNVPICITQESIPQNLADDPTALMIGLATQIPRWVPGSVLKWTAWRSGYDTQDDANHAAIHLAMAADVWNQADVGVQFEFVALAKDASFVICHGGSNGGMLARAFFPNDHGLNLLQVYTAAFDAGWKDNLWKVLVHELGHVIGLRHEFAMEPGKFEPKAVQFGEMNPLSVMNYRREPPELQPSDVAATKSFYSLPNGHLIVSTPITDFTPR